MVQAERDEVERPFIAQLEAMGWTHVPGRNVGTLDAGTPLLADRLAAALERINRVASTTESWMDDSDVTRSIERLTSISLGQGVVQANFDSTDLLLSGFVLSGPSAAHGGASATVQFVEWHEDRVELNEFIVVDQLRVRNRSGDISILDIALFVNGIPLVAVECKSPDVADPIYQAVHDLRHYAGNPLSEDEATTHEILEPAGVPELFRTVQLLVAATAETAYLGTITSTPDHFYPWRSVKPQRRETLAAELVGDAGPLNERHMLTGVVLRPAGLLNFVRHYIIPFPVEIESGGSRTIKLAARHQQYRAAEEAIKRLRTGRVRSGALDTDERGGVIWHTQGSGKSLTMTFLVRRVHLHHELSEFMVVVVTDRTQLQGQLARTLKLSESDIATAKNRTQLEGLLRDGGRRVVFAMIQKYGRGLAFAAESTADGDDRDLVEEYEAAEAARRDGAPEQLPLAPRFPECNTSHQILVLVDEAHRSHTSVLHAALRKAIPNAAKIGFTGTPIMTGRTEDTRRIFSGGSGSAFLDEYRMSEAEHDGVVVRIRYEGRTGEGKVFDRDGLDQNFEDLVRGRTADERRQLLKRWPTERDVAESSAMIQAKAEDMLEHWVCWVLPAGLKAQVAAVSRRAAVEYHHALRRARDTLLAELADFDPETLSDVPPREMSGRMRYLHTAFQFLPLLRRIDFVPVISAGNEKHNAWLHWTDPEQQEAYIARFQRAFPQLAAEPGWMATVPAYPQPRRPDGIVRDNPWSQTHDGPQPDAEPDLIHPDSPIAFLIVKSMLLTGFDAPREQSLYLDRPIRAAELLQAVARVNRPMPGKEIGYVVDYFGVFDHLAEALAAYRQADVDDTMRDLAEEIGHLRPAADAVHELLRRKGIDDATLGGFAGIRRAALAFEDEADRFAFDEALHAFLSALERVLPHEYALDYVDDAKGWALLQKRIRRLYRDAEGGTFTMRRYGRKVRTLIAEHLEGPEIDQAIPPVWLTSDAFDEVVRNLPAAEAAAEMGHALRFHLEQRVKREDPEKYLRLSQRLEEILRRSPGRFEEQVEELGALIEQARRETEEDPTYAGLSPLEQRVYRLIDELLEENPTIDSTGVDLRRLTAGVCDVAAHVMGLVAYQGQHQDLSDLANHLQGELLGVGLRPASADWSAFRTVAEELAAHANDNRQQYLRRARGE